MNSSVLLFVTVLQSSVHINIQQQWTPFLLYCKSVCLKLCIETPQTAIPNFLSYVLKQVYEYYYNINISSLVYNISDYNFFLARMHGNISTHS
jgi:hypothetical protein